MAPEIVGQRFDSYEEFRNWLAANQDSSDGLWLIFAKKGSAKPTVTYAEALDAALQFGWIDGQARRLDEDSYLQRFTPRRQRSPWSMRNRRAAEAMIKEGRIEARGLAEVERAKADGRWERAYEGSANAEPPPDFLAALAQNPAASEAYAKLTSQNRFAIYYRLQDAKRPETRARRIGKFIELLASGETFRA